MTYSPQHGTKLQRTCWAMSQFQALSKQGPSLQETAKNHLSQSKNFKPTKTSYPARNRKEHAEPRVTISSLPKQVPCKKIMIICSLTVRRYSCFTLCSAKFHVNISSRCCGPFSNGRYVEYLTWYKIFVQNWHNYSLLVSTSTRCQLQMIETLTYIRSDVSHRQCVMGHPDPHIIMIKLNVMTLNANFPCYTHDFTYFGSAILYCVILWLLLTCIVCQDDEKQ